MISRLKPEYVRLRISKELCTLILLILKGPGALEYLIHLGWVGYLLAASLVNLIVFKWTA